MATPEEIALGKAAIAAMRRANPKLVRHTDDEATEPEASDERTPAAASS